MNFYLSCLLAFLKTKNGILGFWEFFSSPLNKGVAEVVNIYQHKFSRFY